MFGSVLSFVYLYTNSNFPLIFPCKQHFAAERAARSKLHEQMQNYENDALEASTAVAQSWHWKRNTVEDVLLRTRRRCNELQGKIFAHVDHKQRLQIAKVLAEARLATEREAR